MSPRSSYFGVHLFLLLLQLHQRQLHWQVCKALLSLFPHPRLGSLQRLLASLDAWSTFLINAHVSGKLMT